MKKPKIGRFIHQPSKSHLITASFELKKVLLKCAQIQ